MPTEQYKKRSSLVGALPGPYYQALLALHLLLKAIENGKSCKIKLELDGVGAHDDVVITYGHVNPQTKKFVSEETHFYQLKHSFDGQKLGENDLYRAPRPKKDPSAKQTYTRNLLELNKYFEDWFFWIKSRYSYPHKCIYYTNRSFNETIKKTSKSRDSYIKKEADFLKFSQTLSTHHKPIYEKIKKMILESSWLLQNSPANGNYEGPTVAILKKYYNYNSYSKKQKQDLSENEKTIINTLNRKYNGAPPIKKEELDRLLQTFFSDHYLMAVGQKDINDLEKTVKDQLKGYFSAPPEEKGEAIDDHIFHAIIDDCWHWFRERDQSEVWTNETFERKIRRFHARYQKLPELIGITLDRLSSRLDETKGLVNDQSLFISRTAHEKELTEFLAQHNRKVIQLTGETACGKSTFIAQYFLDQTDLLTGQFLYFEGLEKFTKKTHTLMNDQGSNIKLIVVDLKAGETEAANSWLLKAENRSFLDQSMQQGCTLLFISSKPLDNIATFNLPLLDKDEVLAHLEKHGKLDHHLPFFGKNWPLKTLAEQQIGGLFQQMRFPAVLNQFIQYSIDNAQKETDSLPEIATNYDNRPMDFINLDANVVVPFYDVNDVAMLPGIKWVVCEKPTVLINRLNAKKEVELSEKDTLDSSVALKNALTEQNKSQTRITPIVIYHKTSLFNKHTKSDIETWLQKNRQHNILLLDQQSLSSIELRFKADEEHKNVRCEDDAVLAHLLAHRLHLPSTNTRQLEVDNVRNTLSSPSVFPILIEAVGGAGKSYLLKQIITDHQHKTPDQHTDNYHFIYVSPAWLSSSPTDNLIEFLLNSPLIQSFLEKKLKGVTETDERLEKNRLLDIFSQVIQYDLKHHHIVLVLDGLDEIGPNANQGLVKQMANYRKLITSSRPGMDHSQHQVAKSYELLCFDPKKIKQFIQNYFGKIENRHIPTTEINRFSKYLTRLAGRGMSRFVGLPLQCYLLCETWESHFSKKQPNTLNLTKLYQSFIENRLRRAFQIQFQYSTLIEKSLALTFMKGYLDKLEEAAFLSLFKGKLLNPHEEGQTVSDNESDPSGLIQGSAFTHKTYAQYLSASYLVKRLKENPTDTANVIKAFRYRIDFLPVFCFMAGIVSHGDPSFPQAMDYLGVFWQNLVQAPNDLTGVTEYRLISRCLNVTALAKQSGLFDNLLKRQLLEAPLANEFRSTKTSSSKEKKASISPPTSNKQIEDWLDIFLVSKDRKHQWALRKLNYALSFDTFFNNFMDHIKKKKLAPNKIEEIFINRIKFYKEAFPKYPKTEESLSRYAYKLVKGLLDELCHFRNKPAQEIINYLSNTIQEKVKEQKKLEGTDESGFAPRSFQEPGVNENSLRLIQDLSFDIIVLRNISLKSLGLPHDVLDIFYFRPYQGRKASQDQFNNWLEKQTLPKSITKQLLKKIENEPLENQLELVDTLLVRNKHHIQIEDLNKDLKPFLELLLTLKEIETTKVDRKKNIKKYIKKFKSLDATNINTMIAIDFLLERIIILIENEFGKNSIESFEFIEICSDLEIKKLEHQRYFILPQLLLLSSFSNERKAEILNKFIANGDRLNRKEQFNLLTSLFPLFEDKNVMQCLSEGAQTRWKTLVMSFFTDATEKASHKDYIARYLQHIINLDIKENDLQVLIKPFLAQGLEKYGFWDEDAVRPIFPALLPYFNEDIAKFLVYKTTGGNNKQNYFSIKTWLNPSDLARVPEEKQGLLVETMLSLYINEKKLVDDPIKDKLEIQAYLAYLNPRHFLETIRHLGCPTTSEEERDNLANFILQYAKSNDYALTQVGDTITLYTATEKFEANIPTLVLPDLAKDTRPQLRAASVERPPSPSVFCLGLFDPRKRQRIERSTTQEEPDIPMADAGEEESPPPSPR